MGSGTTLLRLILDSHERIAVPQETGFMRAYTAHQHIPFKWSGRNWAKRMGWSRKELDAELAALYDRIFMRHAERAGKQRWGDKTPLHTWHVDGLSRLFPRCRYVAIVRHPGGSVGSNLTRWTSQPVREAISHYQRYTRELIRQAGRYPRRFVIIRYEELVLQPEPVLRELLEWLREPWSPRVLEHHAVQGARGGKLKVEGRSRADDPIDTARVTRWTRTMEPATRQQLERRLGRLGEFFGYSFDDPGALAPIAPAGRFLIRGPVTNARIDAFADLDLRTRGPVPLADRFLHPRDVQPRPVGRRVPRAEASRPLWLPIWQRLPEPARRRVRRIASRAG